MYECRLEVPYLLSGDGGKIIVDNKMQTESPSPQLDKYKGKSMNKTTTPSLVAVEHLRCRYHQSKCVTNAEANIGWHIHRQRINDNKDKSENLLDRQLLNSRIGSLLLDIEKRH